MDQILSSDVDFLLQTKLELPNLTPRIVRRNRLTSQLFRTGNRKVSLLVAPAGYGKTTLLGEWLSVDTPVKTRLAWLTLDIFDNAPFRFWSYVIASLRKSSPHLAFSPGSFLIQGYDPLDFTKLNPLINEISHLPTSINIILDDYHTITNEDIQKSMAYLLDHQPKNLHIIIASRNKPALPLARLRTQGRLVEITTQDISFSMEETSKYLAEVANVKSIPESASEIFRVTEGWVAGLQMAAISLDYQFQHHIELVNDLMNHSEFPEYFSEEVLAHQEMSARDFLLKTSVLNEFCAPLCNRLLSVNNSQDIINRLVESNLFITPLDNQGTWYRYHPLFASSLRQQLVKNHSQDLSMLHTKALQWFLDNRHPDKAVIHALSSNQLEKAVEIIDQLAIQSILDNNMNQLIHWINAIPDELMKFRPRLGIYNAIAYYLLGQNDLIEINLAKTEAALSEDKANTIPDDEKNKLYWDIKAIRAAIECITGDQKKGLTLARQLINDTDYQGTYIYSMLINTMGITHDILGNFDQAYEYYQKGQQSGINHKFLHGYFQTSCAMALVKKSQGYLQDAIQECKKLLDFARKEKLGNATATLAQAYMLDMALEQNNIDYADELAREILKNIENAIIKESAWISHINGCLALANYFIFRQDLATARYYFKHTLTRHHFITFAGSLFPIAAVDVYVRLLRAEARIEGRSDWYSGEDDIINPETLSSLAGQMAQVHILLCQKKYHEVPERLLPLRSRLEKSGYGGRLVECNILLALAFNALNQEKNAGEAIGNALAVGMRGPFIRLFIEEGELMKGLLCDYLDCIEKEKPDRKNETFMKYLHSLTNTLDTQSADFHPTSSQKPVCVTELHPMEEPLSAREKDFFVLMIKGYSTKQISETLMVSINTTKTHIKNIYRKFGVHSRERLIERAREMNIVE